MSGRSGPTETWWVNKTPGGVYKSPMRPLWKLSELKQMHAGQDTWQEQIILDPEQDATYNSGAPGSQILPSDAPRHAERLRCDRRLFLNLQNNAPHRQSRCLP